jgi:hypothetical protein
MCMPRTIMGAAATGLRTVADGDAERRAAKAARRAAEADARAIRAGAGLAASARAAQGSRSLGALRARQAASGLDPSYGSPLEVGLDLARAEAEATFATVDEGARRAAPADATARGLRRAGRPAPSFALNLLTQTADWSRG